jgi:putative membrane protein
MNKPFKYPIMLLATLALSIYSCNNSDSETNTKKDAEERNEEMLNRTGEADARYVVDAYADGMLEVQMAERVKDRLVSQEAKNVAEMMITEHTAMNNDMRALAEKKQISLPTQLTNMQQDDIDDVAEETGTDLDHAYTDKTVKMHKDAIDLFEKASNKANDAEIKSAFANGLPKLRSHLDMATTARDHAKEVKDQKKK